jgi:hypothetical protein
MFPFLKKALSGRNKPSIEIVHDSLGPMTFLESEGYWEAASGEVFHSIPGDASGPYPQSVQFILSKLAELDHYFDKCSEYLVSIASGWDSIPKGMAASELFQVSAISVDTADNREWEICFETRPEFRWIHIGLQFENEEILSNDIST